MTSRINVLMMPDYRVDNPFQHLLEQALSKNNVEVSFARGYKRVFPIYRQVKLSSNVNVLHLHWITPFIKGKNSFIVAIYAFKFICDLVLTKLTGVKIVWTIHNQVSHDTPFAGIELIVRRITSRIVDAAILHGNSLEELIRSQYKISGEKLSIINLGNYRDVYPPLMDKQEAREKFSIPREIKKVYLHQGLLKRYKGIEDLIGVWLQNAEKLKNQLLIIAGKASDASYESNLRSLIGDSEKIVLIPRYVTDEEITALYSACDVVVLPFKRIMASSSLMVAISFGKPVIAPRIGACEELLGNADDLLYVPDEHHSGLIDSINRSIEVDLEELGKRTTERGDLYNWGDIGKKTFALYQHVINHGSQG